MLRLMNDLPDSVVGIHATGEVTKDEIEHILIPAIDDLAERTGKIKYLLLLDTELKNWDWGAWVSDAKLGLKHLSNWEKIAVVSDNDGVNKFTDAFSAIVPGKAKGFKMGELEEAKKWVQ